MQLLGKQRDEELTSSSSKKLVVSFRGHKVEMSVLKGTTAVLDVKSRMCSAVDSTLNLTPNDVKLLYKGKVLMDDTQDMYDVLGETKSMKNKVYRLMATGVSASEAQSSNQEFMNGMQQALRIRDDLTEAGKREIAKRQQMFIKATAGSRARAAPQRSTHGFGKIETLPMLPDQAKAKEILTSLANDPGILACMAKHQWHVGSLAELYPEGKVGQTDVCVMGLNKNKGQQILLRIRTDDLKGFRKILSIRKVLFHELAHNVHSEHNNDFFQLMRQIERECNDMDWTSSNGQTASSSSGGGHLDVPLGDYTPYSGGTYRLGGNDSSIPPNVPVRELAARAAMLRLTAEEEEIQQHCGCGRDIAVRTAETTSDSHINTATYQTVQEGEDDEEDEM